MLTALLIALAILWILGYVSIPGLPNAYLFSLNHHQITLWNVLTFLVFLWIVGLLPSPLREIAFVLLILWTLSVLGFIAFLGLPSLLLIAIISGVLVYLFQESRYSQNL